MGLCFQSFYFYLLVTKIKTIPQKVTSMWFEHAIFWSEAMRSTIQLSDLIFNWNVHVHNIEMALLLDIIGYEYLLSIFMWVLMLFVSSYWLETTDLKHGIHMVMVAIYKISAKNMILKILWFSGLALSRVINKKAWPYFDLSRIKNAVKINKGLFAQV